MGKPESLPIAAGPVRTKSEAMRLVWEMVDALADTGATPTILITGESGSGRETVAREIHRTGPRGRKPFIKIDCGSLNPSLVESELFGHARGAFTGATTAKPGLFKAADGGVLFLRDVDLLSPEIQAKLLRVLQDGEFRPVGASVSTQVDVQVIASTETDLEERVRQGKFREDLYYRLKVVELRVPPLRYHMEDLPELIEYFLHKKCHAFRPATTRAQDEAQPEQET